MRKGFLFAVLVTALFILAGCSDSSVVNDTTSSIRNIDPNRTTGETTIVAKPTGADRAYGVAFDNKGTMYMVCGDNSGNGTISKVTPGGKVSDFVSIKGSFIGPGIDVYKDGNLYVAVGDKVIKVTRKGEKTTFAAGFPNAFDIKFDKRDNIYVADDIEKEINMFDAALKYTKHIFINYPFERSEHFGMMGFDFDSTYQNIYMADAEKQRILKYPLSSRGFVKKPVVFADGIPGITGIAVDSKNNVYVSTSGNSPIIKINSKGEKEAINCGNKISQPIGLKFGKKGFDPYSLYVSCNEGIAGIYVGETSGK